MIKARVFHKTEANDLQKSLNAFLSSNEGIEIVSVTETIHDNRWYLYQDI